MELVHPLTGGEQITVQLTIVESPRFHLNHLSAPQYTTGKRKRVKSIALLWGELLR